MYNLTLVYFNFNFWYFYLLFGDTSRLYALALRTLNPLRTRHLTPVYISILCIPRWRAQAWLRRWSCVGRSGVGLPRVNMCVDIIKSFIIFISLNYSLCLYLYCCFKINNFFYLKLQRGSRLVLSMHVDRVLFLPTTNWLTNMSSNAI